MPSPKLLVGLTGGICCGKSTVAKTFEKNNIPNVDADIVARQVVEPGTLGHQLIVSFFGNDYLNEDDTINREKLGALVFSDKKSLEALNKIMTPLIQKESQDQITNLYNAGYNIVIYNAALICENGNADKYRPLIVVSCPQDIQLARLMSRNNLTRDEAMARINAQFSSEKRVEFADFVIDSSMSIKNSVLQTEVVIYELQQLSKFNLVAYARKNS